VDVKTHWEMIYATKAPDEVSWYRPHLETSLAWIERFNPSPTAYIIDVGCGESTLIDDLLERGYRNLTVLDISQTALEANRKRMGPAAEHVRWIAGDVTQAALPACAYDVWHDRAVFHFLNTAEERSAYIQQALRALKPGGHLILATFGPDAPAKCSGLEVVRYNAGSLAQQLGEPFLLLESLEELHKTPSGADQPFLYCHFQIAGGLPDAARR
jgi:SAM-dependent methyltransferase